MKGKKEDDVNVSNLILRDSKGCGVRGGQCASFHLDNVSVENSGWDGVRVFGSKRNTMKNCRNIILQLSTKPLVLFTFKVY